MDLDLVADDLDSFEDIAIQRPLTMWRAWHQDAPRTSQRAVLQALQYTHELVIFGGNRSGKTELSRVALVALLSGSDHPDARDFWINNGCDPDAFPRGPDDGWIIAVTSDDSLRYHRQQLLSLIPKWGPRHESSEAPGANWHAWNLMGRGAARLEWRVPGYTRPATIWFKSEDQDVRTFQGDAIRAALHDEEGINGKRYEQTRYRLIDKDGYQIFSDTPIHGRSWVYNKFEKNRSPGVKVMRIYSEDNPHLPAHRIGILVNDAVRGRGLFVAAEGRVWPMFSEATHVLPSTIALPRDALRFRAIDFGTRHPFACVHAAVLRSPLYVTPEGGGSARVIPEKSAILYREHYVANQTLAWHVARIKEAEGWVRKATVKGQKIDPLEPSTFRWEPGPRVETIEACWADSEDPQLVLQLNNDHGLPTNKANKARKAGREAVATLLTGDEHGPKLYVLDNCVNVIREWEDYVWGPSTNVEGVEKEEPSTVSDHTCDCGRYLAMGLLAGYL